MLENRQIKSFANGKEKKLKLNIHKVVMVCYNIDCLLEFIRNPLKSKDYRRK